MADKTHTSGAAGRTSPAGQPDSGRVALAQSPHTPGAAGRTSPAGQPDSVRNVVLVGHSGAGKTTLTEALLAHTGTIQRTGRGEEGTTVSDFDEGEIRQQRPVNLTP